MEAYTHFIHGLALQKGTWKIRALGNFCAASSTKGVQRCGECFLALGLAAADGRLRLVVTGRHRASS